AGIALRDLCQGPASARDYLAVLDQETPASAVAGAAATGDGPPDSSEAMCEVSTASSVDADSDTDSDTQSVAPANVTPAADGPPRLSV
ncbi:hypothetical protein U2060_15050, partial [Listeria monocytogenes]|uniref:hypothetical protein n=1 Tax=Listeria monocytogenes TaxID=1639 RepID=UPI002FDC0B43